MKLSETQRNFRKAMAHAKDNGDSIYNYHLTRRQNRSSDQIPRRGFTPAVVIVVILFLAMALSDIIHSAVARTPHALPWAD